MELVRKEISETKFFICKKESQETRHWLRMIVAAVPDLKINASELLQEAKELAMIFNKISSSIDKST